MWKIFRLHLKGWWEIKPSCIVLLLRNSNIGEKELFLLLLRILACCLMLWKKKISNMHHVFCGLHVIHNLRTYAEKKQFMSGQWEKIIEIQDNMHGDFKVTQKAQKSLTNYLYCSYFYILKIRRKEGRSHW